LDREACEWAVALAARVLEFAFAVGGTGMDWTAMAAGMGAAGAALGSAWGRLRGAVEAQRALEDQPRLRREFDAHADEDRLHHGAIREALARIEGAVEVIRTDVSWLKGRRTNAPYGSSDKGSER